jgi:hypothetical protein
MEYKKAMQELKKLIQQKASFADFEEFLEQVAFSENITTEQYNFILDIAHASIF